MAVFTHGLKCLAIALAATRQTRQRREENSLKFPRVWVERQRVFAFPAKVVFPMLSHEHRNHVDLHTCYD